MSVLKEKHALVIGGSMGGLAAAKALATHFGRVSVLELDALPSGAEPRHGTPQARHIHALLSGGRRALSELFPGFDDDLERAGAVRLNAGLDLRFETPVCDSIPQRDLGMAMFCISRPLLELVTRHRVEQQENIVFLTGRRAIELCASVDRCAVTGVRYKDVDGQIRSSEADLVVDASGRGELTLGFLDSIGFERPVESEIRIDEAYATATFEIPADAPTTWKAVMTMPNPAKNSRGALLFPTENNRWMVGLIGNHGDSPPGDVDGFMAFASGLRTTTVYDAIKNANRVGEIVRFAFPRSVRRHYERCTRFPTGLLPFADAICRFNPIYGQGMSVAAQQARILEKLIESSVESSAGSNGLAPSFFEACQPVLEGPWAVAQSDFAYPKTTGSRPADMPRRLQYVDALTQLYAIDPSIHKLYIEVVHLLQPQSALVGPSVTPRVVALMIGGKSLGPTLLRLYDGVARAFRTVHPAKL